MRVCVCVRDWMSVGTGRYGRVRLVKHVPTGEFFALKICPRAKLTREDQIRHAISERRVHTSISHPYIVKLYGPPPRHRRDRSRDSLVPRGV